MKAYWKNEKLVKKGGWWKSDEYKTSYEEVEVLSISEKKGAHYLGYDVYPYSYTSYLIKRENGEILTTTEIYEPLIQVKRKK